MPELSRESLEYVCTRFRSPHLARKYGHKIYSDYEDPYLEALRSRAFSSDPDADDAFAPLKPERRRRATIEDGTLFSGTGQSIKRRQVNSWQDGDYKLYCQMLSHSSADMHNRDLVKKTTSVKPASRLSISSEKCSFSFMEIPKIFIYHASTLKNHFRNWN